MSSCNWAINSFDYWLVCLIIDWSVCTMLQLGQDFSILLKN